MIKKYEAEGLPSFYLANEYASLIIRIRNSKPELLHFGAHISAEDAVAMAPRIATGWGCSVLYREGEADSCLQTLPLCFSESGRGDYRESPLELSISDENDKLVPVSPDFRYDSFRIVPGREEMHSGLPQASGQSESLTLSFSSGSSLMTEDTKLDLIFSVFETAISCRCVFTNGYHNQVYINKIMSFMLDLKGSFEMTTLNGQWIAEAHAEKQPVGHARIVNESREGFSSNSHNPAFMLSRAGASEDEGEVYGFNMLYSGNHYSSVQLSPQGLTRVMQGISPAEFSMCLESGDSFETPETVLCFSDRGFNGMSSCMHHFINKSVVPEYWRGRERPVLYNSWEGCTFDFSEAKLLSLAKKAKRLGCELFVLDDGWFGARDSDNAGLGDYNVNRRKLPDGLSGLAEKIKKTGMRFGLWFEPEAVNPDSNLYRAHPDWAVHEDGLEDVYGRNELLLDLRRNDVRDYIVESVSGILDSADISYVKWDMNRDSTLRGAEAHEYILGLYDVLRRIFSSRPEILLEGCASGGNRFDAGMLCFAPQIWASDDTDPIERLSIQNGLSYFYPQSTMGAHVSAAPHSQTLRSTPLSTRANVAFFGVFGIELELNHLSNVDTGELKDAIDYYKAHRSLFQFGSFRRETAEKGAVSWSVSLDGEAVSGVFHSLLPAAPGYERLFCASLDKDAVFTVESRPQLLRVGRFGALLKYVLPFEPKPGGILIKTADAHYKMADGVQSISCSGAALKAGVSLLQRFAGSGYDPGMRTEGDFLSNVYFIRKEDAVLSLPEPEENHAD